MNENKQLDGALCADGQTGAAQAAEAAAPAEVKKKYVPPTMKVIPLGPQRMLATSGVPVVRIYGGISLYNETCPSPSSVTCDDFWNNFKNVELPHVIAEYDDWGAPIYCDVAGVVKMVALDIPFGLGWKASSFLAEVVLNEPCSFGNAVSGTYRGTPVLVEFYFHSPISDDMRKLDKVRF